MKINQLADGTVLTILVEDESLSTFLICIHHFKHFSQ